MGAQALQFGHTSCATQLKIKETCNVMQILVPQSICDGQKCIQGHILALSIKDSETVHPKFLGVCL